MGEIGGIKLRVAQQRTGLPVHEQGVASANRHLCLRSLRRPTLPHGAKSLVQKLQSLLFRKAYEALILQSLSGSSVKAQSTFDNFFTKEERRTGFSPPW